MSEANRKRMYNELIAAKRFNDIDPGLIKEFGPVLIPEPPKDESSKKIPDKKRWH